MRRGDESDGRLIPIHSDGAVTNDALPFEEEMAMPTRKPNKKRGPAGSRGKTPRARAVPFKRKKRSATKELARTGSPARATKKVHGKRADATHAQVTSTKPRAGKHTVTRKAGAAKGAVTGAVHGAMTAVTPEGDRP